MLIKTQVQPTKGSKQLSACIAAISRKFTCLSQQLCACNFSQTKGLQTPWANLKQSFIFLMLWHEHFLNWIKHSEPKKEKKQNNQANKNNAAADFLLWIFLNTFLTPGVAHGISLNQIAKQARSIESQPQQKQGKRIDVTELLQQVERFNLAAANSVS